MLYLGQTKNKLFRVGNLPSFSERTLHEYMFAYLDICLESENWHDDCLRGVIASAICFIASPVSGTESRRIADTPYVLSNKSRSCTHVGRKPWRETFIIREYTTVLNVYTCHSEIHVHDEGNGTALKRLSSQRNVRLRTIWFLQRVARGLAYSPSESPSSLWETVTATGSGLCLFEAIMGVPLSSHVQSP